MFFSWLVLNQFNAHALRHLAETEVRNTDDPLVTATHALILFYLLHLLYHAHNISLNTTAHVATTCAKVHVHVHVDGQGISIFRRTS